jgi:hypothetical protein
MDSNARYFYQQAIDQQMELLMRKMRVAQIVKEYDQRAYDNFIENEIDEELEAK